MTLAQSSVETQTSSHPWRGFAPGVWQSRVNVREFIRHDRGCSPRPRHTMYLVGVKPAEQCEKSFLIVR
jgi:hypothetical protein